MAKTSDPHAAAIKSWQTRARNAGGGGVVQQRKDWVDPQIAEALEDWGNGYGPAYKEGRKPLTPHGRRMTKALKTLPVFRGKFYRGMTKALKTLPVFRGKFYRGMTMKTAEVEALVAGKVFTVKKHSSASKKRDEALMFMDDQAARGRRQVLLTVEGRGRDYSASKAGKEFREDEVVLMAGTKLRVVSVRRVNEGMTSVDDLFYITVREVR